MCIACVTLFLSSHIHTQILCEQKCILVVEISSSSIPTHLLYIHTYAYIHTHIQMHTHIHTYTYTYIHTHIHTYTHTNAYIHTHIQIQTYIRIQILMNMSLLVLPDVLSLKTFQILQLPVGFSFAEKIPPFISKQKGELCLEKRGRDCIQQFANLPWLLL